jgi:hypothetical protein
MLTPCLRKPLHWNRASFKLPCLRIQLLSIMCKNVFFIELKKFANKSGLI